ncbi:MAG TPA: mycofactocin-associated electron transfer flavoprotein beta subunit [Microthrixaceae bacterium]|nr:mycofactocin-associated electron transfer flavoprotein beta subunit [Microthrixaceae bacterium]
MSITADMSPVVDGHQSGEASEPPVGAEASIAVCVKWAVLHAEVDPIRGTVQSFNHDAGFSEADQAAVETALRLAEEWTAAGTPTSVVALCVGPEDADEALRDLLACGVSHAVRIGSESSAGPAASSSGASSAAGHSGIQTGGPIEQFTSRVVAELLAKAIIALGSQMVVCGDVSADRGSGSVPAFLAHHLGAAQALGLIEVTPAAKGSAVFRVNGVRRLDGARREVLHVNVPAVISVEGAVGDLRRASLPATIAARSATVEVRPVAGEAEVDSPVLGPWRPRARVIAAPDEPDALGRIVSLTGAKSNRTPARTEHLDPTAAAQAIVAQLVEWGYIDGGSVSGRDSGSGSGSGKDSDSGSPEI